MTRRRSIVVATDPTSHSGFVSGPGARELIVACGGRPLWMPLSRVWSTSEKTALDVLALAEADGYAVNYERMERGRR